MVLAQVRKVDDLGEMDVGELKWKSGVKWGGR